MSASGSRGGDVYLWVRGCTPPGHPTVEMAVEAGGNASYWNAFLFISESDTLSTFRFFYRKFTQTDRLTEVGVLCLFKRKATFYL